MSSQDNPLAFQIGCSIVGYNFANWTTEGALDSMAALGFSGVEMNAPLGWGTDRGMRLKDALHARGLAPMKYVTMGHGVDIVPPTMAVVGPAVQEAAQAYRREIEVARAAGFTKIVVVAGLYSASPLDSAQQLGAAAVTLRHVADIGAEHGVEVVIETHQGSIAHDAASFLELRDAAGGENIFANVDPSNYAAVGADVLAGIDDLGPLIRGFHVKDMVAGTHDDPKWAPAGAGVVRWRPILSRLLTAGYRGPLIIEYEAGITGAFPADAEYGARVSAEHVRAALREIAAQG